MSPRKSQLPEQSAPPDYSVRAVNRVCDILDLFREQVFDVSLTDVAAATSLPKSSALRYLATLQRRGYVERRPGNGGYGPGPSLLGAHAGSLDLLRSRLAPVLRSLRDDFHETINLGVLDGSQVHYLETIEPERAVRFIVASDGKDAVHSTALGKALLSRLPEPTVRSILRQSGMPARTPNTITSIPAYLEELARVRDQGYALDDGENEGDARCISVLLEGEIPASVSLSAPLNRVALEDVPVIAKRLRDRLNELGAPTVRPQNLGGRRGVGADRRR